ncbi:uncharacterized protein LOC131951990 isoform X2 [Physella acuta]|uniref:uncharacterized protein LOC131951990 isoform X2 n=1 Tax=Physella acuta TaxID=109671 RepID=UPI0027DE066D|nr:uncharacterized protein LOC131951990 isoform X2 [Physella acuta]
MYDTPTNSMNNGQNPLSGSLGNNREPEGHADIRLNPDSNTIAGGNVLQQDKAPGSSYPSNDEQGTQISADQGSRPSQPNQHYPDQYSGVPSQTGPGVKQEVVGARPHMLDKSGDNQPQRTLAQGGIRDGGRGDGGRGDVRDDDGRGGGRVDSGRGGDGRGDGTKSKQTNSHIEAVWTGPKKTVAQPASKTKPSQVLSPHSDTVDEDSAGKIQLTPHRGKAHQTPSKSQDRYTSPKWLDNGLYMPYGISDSSGQPSRQRQPQVQYGTQYLDPQYYPPYNNADSLDTLQSSLLGNIGSAEDFSQFGGPYLGRDKSLSSSYQTGGSGYPSYPEPSYGSQYPPSSRYDYSGEYRASPYQDSDFYPSLPHQPAYRPAVGLYEDLTAGQRLTKPNALDKSAMKSSQSIQAEPVADQREEIKPENPVTLSPPVVEVMSTASVRTTGSVSQSPPPTTTTSTTTLRPAHDGHRANEHVFMSSEKVIIASATSNAEGPIIALSLGLAFTVILLVLVGCRLRNVRHRLRKGRPLHQNEADYLINGMYL